MAHRRPDGMAQVFMETDSGFDLGEVVSLGQDPFSVATPGFPVRPLGQAITTDPGGADDPGFVRASQLIVKADDSVVTDSTKPKTTASTIRNFAIVGGLFAVGVAFLIASRSP